MGETIKEKEIISKTEKTVTYLTERGTKTRENIITEWQSWHDTKQDAIDYYENKINKKIESLKRTIEYNRSNLKNFKLTHENIH